MKNAHGEVSLLGKLQAEAWLSGFKKAYANFFFKYQLRFCTKLPKVWELMFISIQHKEIKIKDIEKCEKFRSGMQFYQTITVVTLKLSQI